MSKVRLNKAFLQLQSCYLQIFRRQLNDKKVFPKLLKCGDEEFRVLEESTSKQKRKHLVLEGWRLVSKAVQLNLPLEAVYCTDVSLVERCQLTDMQHVYRVNRADMKIWSSVDTPPGIIGVFRRPSRLLPVMDDAFPLTLVCDQVREPGNLGALLRVAHGAGCARVLLSKGCADVWERKVLRSATGSQMELPVESNLTWDQIDARLSNHCVLLADCNTSSASLYDLPLPTQPLALVVGGEAEGPTLTARRVAEARGCLLHVPMHRSLQSLNVACAAAVVLFELRRQLTITLT